MDKFKCLLCQLSFNLVERPPIALIPCCHVICGVCHSSKVMGTENGQGLICPIDLSICLVGIKHVGIMGALMEVTAAASAEVVGAEAVAKCELCDSEHPGHSFCLECEQIMCEMMARIHSRSKSSRSHNLVPLTGSERKMVCPFSTHCLVHRNAREIFDRTCNKAICLKCSALEHRNHELVSFESVATEFRPALVVMSEAARMRATAYNRAEAAAENALNNLTLRSVASELQIRDAFRKFVDTVAQRERCLLSDFVDANKEKQRSLTSFIERVRLQRSLIESAVEQASVCAGLSDDKFAVAFSELSAVFEGLEILPGALIEPPTYGALSVSFSTEVLNANMSITGHIVDISAFPSESSAEGSGVAYVILSRKGGTGHFLVTARDRSGLPRSSGSLEVCVLEEASAIDVSEQPLSKAASEIIDNGNGTYDVTYEILASMNWRGEVAIVHVTLQGQHIRGSPFRAFVVREEPVTEVEGALVCSVGSRGSNDAQFLSAAFLDSGPMELFVADEGNSRIQIFHVNDFSYLGVIGGVRGVGNGQFRNPMGVAFSHVSREVFVADHGNNRIQVFRASDGAYMRQWGTGGGGDGQLNSPVGIALSDKGELYVCDYGNRRIQVFRASDGAFLRKWGTLGCGDGEINSPMGIAVSRLEEVYVAEYSNHRVQVFCGKDGSFLRKWGVYGNDDGQLVRPFSLALSRNARELFVTEHGKARVQVFGAESGEFLRAWTLCGATATGVSVGVSGRCFVSSASSGQIFKFE